MALRIPLAVQVRTRLSAVLAGEMSLRDPYHWFQPATWDVERTGNADAVRLTHDLAHLFSELSAGDLDRDDVRQELETIAAPIGERDHRTA